MRILLTGAAGFIGSHLSEALIRRGDSVVALDNLDPYYDPGLKRENLALLAGLKSAFEPVEGDVRDSALLDRLASPAPFHAVIHLASLAGVRSSIERPADYADVNVRGTALLLDFARRHGIPRFVFASSSSVYGERRRAPLRENDPVDRPLSPYAATKQAGEGLCHSFHHTAGLNVSVLRFFSVYGPRQRPDMAIRRFAQLMADGQPIPLFGDGTSERDYTFVADIVRGLLLALDRCHGFETYNLGCGCPVRLIDMVHTLARELEVDPRLVFHAPVRGDASATCADISRARSGLGYEPEVDLESGVRAFADWFKSRWPARPEAKIA